MRIPTPSCNAARSFLVMRSASLAVLALALAANNMRAQQPTTPPPTPTPATVQGGTIHGTVVAGAPGKPGTVPLPGVTITATNTLTGKKYAAATDVDGAYAMTIPRNGRYVVRAELTGFAPTTVEVILNGDLSASIAKPTDFGMELASRAAAAEAKQEQTASATTLTRGLQNLNLAGGDLSATDASAGGGNTGVSMPSLANLQDSVTGGAASAGSDAIAITGQAGETNGLANISEDEIRDRISEAVARARASGQIAGGGDPTNAIVGALGSMIGGGFGGPGGGHGGRGGGGFGNFRNFNPAQPHGSVYWQGGNNAWDSAPWLPSLVPVAQPAGYQNRYGLSFMGSPYIPGLIKPDTKQFVFINLNGQKNLSSFTADGRVPTAAERAGDFSSSEQEVSGQLLPVTLYDPSTGAPIPGNNLLNVAMPASLQAARVAAQNLLTYYPLCNINCTSADPSVYNYQTVSNAGNNNVSLNSRYVRNFGQAANQPFGGFGRRSSNGPATLRQNLNSSFSYSHSAQDVRNIFLALGGATESNGYALSAGYVVGYGRLSNNATVTWNRSQAETRNYFTDTANDPTRTTGIAVPNQTSNFADSNFYNGLPSIELSNFQSLTNEAPSESINQTINFSDFVAYRHQKHNFRLGFDVRRVHADSIGGTNPLGSFSFTGYATESPSDQENNASGSTTQPSTGSAFADFLLGLPTSTAIQAGLYKFYLRQNVIDGYATDDWRIKSNLTLNYGVRWEYFSPYVEKNNRMVNLDHSADFTSIDPVEPGQSGAYEGAYPRSLVNPDRTMFAPRLGFAYRLRDKGLTKNTVLRGGYGVNYNTTQYQTFARQLTYQPPFAATQTNAVNSTANPSTCTTEIDGSTPSMTLADGFGCSSKPIQNNYAVDKNYRLGMVQAYNLNLQRTIPLGIVLNIGYSGSKGSNLDVVGDPNLSPLTPLALISPNAQSFQYETSVAGSHLNQLVVSAQMRQHKGISLSAFYTYGHSIDNASSIGGSGVSTVQNFHRLDLEEANSSFDIRQQLTGNWLIELPFGPNRAFLNQGGFWSHALDGFGFSGSYTFATGNYFTPQYQNTVAEDLVGGNYTLRPDRVFTQPIHGPGSVHEYFNPAAFTAPVAYGTASRNSIEGPGTVSVSTALSRVFQLGDTRSFEVRLTASNIFNTVQYSGINTTENSATFGQVTSAASMRTIQALARYRF